LKLPGLAVSWLEWARGSNRQAATCRNRYGHARHDYVCDFANFGREKHVIVQALAIPAVKLLTPVVHRDARGEFAETFTRAALAGAGILADFVQDNHSRSPRVGTVRGLHFQSPPHAQGKLVRVTRGAVFDVAVDVRTGSPTFGRHVTATLSANNWAQLWVPPGFAHGFCTLEPDTDVIYKVTTGYAPASDVGLLWDDPALGVAWPVSRADAILSDKDRRQPVLADMKPAFHWSGDAEGRT
jgi:dTDP-4-dehydrorhamnose 3,5-epimerase